FFSAGKGDVGKALDMFIIRFNGKLDPNFLAQWFTSDQVGVWNWQRWANKDFDALLDQGSSELDDTKRAALFVRAQQIMEESAAFVWLTYDVGIFVHQAWLKPALLPSGIDWALDRFAPA
ncbi:MAG: ABC transporter substrate-binding protein, partial [Gemmatimonadaceae bacterium]|nr:ABC transporter substrate-binding protein [Acetobacteraceae bacterium]